MKTGIAAGLAALVLLTGCSGNRNEAPAQATAAPPPAAEAQPAAKPATTAPTPAASTAAPTPPVAPAAAERPVKMTDVAGNVIETVPPLESPATETTKPPAETPQAPPDPLEQMRQGEAKRADYQKQLAEAQAKVVVADASIHDWQNTILAFKNPFRPRPQLQGADAQAIEGKDGVSRVAWAEGKLAEATATRDAAQKALDDLKANPPN